MSYCLEVYYMGQNSVRGWWWESSCIGDTDWEKTSSIFPVCFRPDFLIVIVVLYVIECHISFLARRLVCFPYAAAGLACDRNAIRRPLLALFGDMLDHLGNSLPDTYCLFELYNLLQNSWFRNL